MLHITVIETVIKSSRVLFLVVTVFLCQFNSCSLKAQNGPELNQHNVVITDLALDNVLNQYCKEVNSKVIAVIIERYDGDYTYTLFGIGTYEKIIKNPTTSYRDWKGRMLLIYSGIEEAFGMDSVQIKKFYATMRPLLPDGHSEKKISENLYESTTLITHPIAWRFKVDDNKILWLRKRLDYQLEKIPYFKL